MAYYEYLKEVLGPLRLYELDEGPGAVELQIAGEFLDSLFAAFADFENESVVQTAETYGLEGYEEIFPRYALGKDVNDRRDTILSLMRIDGHSHTIGAIRNVIICFGINAEIDELPGEDTVVIGFPGVHGAPRRFANIRWLMDMVIPCHLEIFYDLVRTTWAELEAKNITWAYVESLDCNWEDFEGI